MKTNKNLKNKIFAGIAASAIALNTCGAVLSTSAKGEKNDEEKKPKHSATASVSHAAFGRKLVIESTDGEEVTLPKNGLKRLKRHGLTEIASKVDVKFNDENNEYGWKYKPAINLNPLEHVWYASRFRPKIKLADLAAKVAAKGTNLATNGLAKGANYVMKAAANGMNWANSHVSNRIPQVNVDNVPQIPLERIPQLPESGIGYTYYGTRVKANKEELKPISEFDPNRVFDENTTEEEPQMNIEENKYNQSNQ